MDNKSQAFFRRDYLTLVSMGLLFAFELARAVGQMATSPRYLPAFLVFMVFIAFFCWQCLNYTRIALYMALILSAGALFNTLIENLGDPLQTWVSGLMVSVVFGFFFVLIYRRRRQK
jgi:hypothetical protein